MWPSLADKPNLLFVLTLHGEFDVLSSEVVTRALQEKDVQDLLHLWEVDFFFAFITNNMSWRSHLGFTSKLHEVFKSHASQYDTINMLTAINSKMDQKVIKDPSSSLLHLFHYFTHGAS